MNVNAGLNRQSHKLLEPPKLQNENADDIIQHHTAESATINATKQLNEKTNEIASSQAIEPLPKVLYLKKVTHTALQQKTNNSVGSTEKEKEPIPKLIVSTKSMKFPSQITTPDGVRYFATPRKSTTPENIDQSSVKQVEAIKSTKIIIKGITSQDKRLVVCESPTTTDPLSSPQSSPTLKSPKNVTDSSKNESKETKDGSTMRTDEYEAISGPIPEADEANRPSSNASTPRTNREMKQLQKTMKESKVLTDYVADASRRNKRKLNETVEGEETAAIPLDTSQNNVIGNSSLSETKGADAVGSIGTITVRRNTRSLNAEFSAKQRKFLAGIQKHSRDSDEDHSDDERGRGRRKIRKSGKLFPPILVRWFFL